MFIRNRVIYVLLVLEYERADKYEEMLRSLTLMCVYLNKWHTYYRILVTLGFDFTWLFPRIRRRSSDPTTYNLNLRFSGLPQTYPLLLFRLRRGQALFEEAPEGSLANAQENLRQAPIGSVLHHGV